ncbi:6629_t:CDS:2, partial [Gigaspora rosea]
MIIKQCICGSYHEKEIQPNSQVSAAHYSYAGCLAFITLYLHDNEIYAIAEYLQHFEHCFISKPQHDPPYKLLPYIKKNFENLLDLNVRTSDILAQNARTQILQKTWNINLKHDVAKNLDQFLGTNEDESELKEACLHYQPYTKETGHLEIIICTHEQQDYVWKYGHNNLILVDGTFRISKHKLL